MEITLLFNYYFKCLILLIFVLYFSLIKFMVLLLSYINILI